MYCIMQTTYNWTNIDRFVGAFTLVLSFYLLYYADKECDEAGPSGSNFVSTQVTILNRTCEDDGWLFVSVLVLSILVQWVRGIIGWELNQEARVILKGEPDQREWRFRFHYHRLSILSSLLYILSVVLIIAQNLWVFLALAVGYEISIYRYLKSSPSDTRRAEDREHAHEVTQASVMSRLHF